MPGRLLFRRDHDVHQRGEYALTSRTCLKKEFQQPFLGDLFACGLKTVITGE
jgi:hypothetical protein